MSPIVKLAVPIALLPAFQPARVPLLGPLRETNVTLTRTDLDMIQTTLLQKIHGKPAGTKASWSDPASGNSGTITLLRVIERQGSVAIRSSTTTTRPRSGGPRTASR